MIKCGKIDNVFAAVDFGVDVDPEKAFAMQRKYEPNGPLVNNEFYPGWLDHWQYSHQKVATKDIVASLRTILSYNASVNLLV